MRFEEIEPRIRLVNNFSADYSHVQRERVIYDYEFMYIMNGGITIFNDGKRYDLKKSDMFFFRPGIRNHMETYEGGKLRTHCVHFDWYGCTVAEDFRAEDVYYNHVMTPTLQALISRLEKRSCPSPEDLELPAYMPGLSYEKFAPLFSECYYSFLRNSAAAKLSMRSAFLKIAAGLAEIYGTAEKAGVMHPKIIRAVDYIKEHYAERLTVEDMAKRYDLSRKYFGTLFKESTGKSMNSFLNGVRIDEAKRMLLGTAMSIEEISARIGYSDPFYFSRCFREYEGCPPARYRNITG